MTGDVSGVRDTRDVSAEINQALESKFVKAIVLEIDSGGGSVDGTEELAGVVANADKPVIVWGDGLIASAAYWVASQADYIMMSSATTSEVGSIGVYSIYANYSGYLEKEGVDMRILRSTGSSDKVALNPIEEPSQEAIDVEVAQMDVILGTFTKAVRGARAEKLTNAQNQDIDVFTGKVFNASEGIELGLVDSIGTLDDAIFLAVDMAADKFSDN
ncbi:protease 4-like, partial [Sycon ciliatum]|uniref:protease 4-like n=1 Tax=Sycon ciliatum TaxID=27933 RepID=UPI0031F6264E